MVFVFWFPLLFLHTGKRSRCIKRCIKKGWFGQVGGGSLAVVPDEVAVVPQLLFDVLPALKGGVDALAARGLLFGGGGVEGVPAVVLVDVAALFATPGEERGAVRGVEAFAFFAVEGGVAAANAPMLVFKGEDVAVVVVVACACGGVAADAVEIVVAAGTGFLRDKAAVAVVAQVSGRLAVMVVLDGVHAAVLVVPDEFAVGVDDDGGSRVAVAVQDVWRVGGRCFGSSPG